MYIISTTTLVSIIALASSLAVVVQAAATPINHTKVPKCTEAKQANAKTCVDWRWGMETLYSTDELAIRVKSYNKDVNNECTDLVIGDTVRVFLL